MARRRVSSSSSSRQNGVILELKNKGSSWQIPWLLCVTIGLATTVAAGDQPAAVRATGTAQASASQPAAQVPGTARPQASVEPSVQPSATASGQPVTRARRLACCGGSFAADTHPFTGKAHSYR